MAKIDDGGPAFPLVYSATSDRTNTPEWSIKAHGGMSLRDYFAGQALCEYLAAHMANDKQVDEDVVADCAYSMADAMLRARAASSTAEISYEQAARRGERQSPADVQRAHLKEFGK